MECSERLRYVTCCPCCAQIYIHRVLKEIHPDISVSQKAISVLDSFTKDMHDRIAHEAGDLCRRHNKATLSSREVSSLPTCLSPLACDKGGYFGCTHDAQGAM